MKNEYLTSEVKVFIDGKEITNFFPAEVQLIATDSDEALKFLKCRFDFSGTIILTRKTMRRLKWLVWKHWIKQWWKGWFKNDTH